MFFRRSRSGTGSGSRRDRPSTARLAWIIADIHGQHDLLEAVLRPVLRDLQGRARGQGALIFLGDYIDRGVHARQVVDRILSLKIMLERQGLELVTLMGNHEDLLLRFLDQPQSGPDWCELGGRETLMSYGVTLPDAHDAAGWESTAADLADRMPAEHREFFSGLTLSHTEGGYHCVHAGVRPGVPLDAQKRDDMLWLRDAFLSDHRQFEKVIIHGHTPAPDVVRDARRIGLDTGAYATGVLTALRLEGETGLLLQTRRVGRAIEVQLSDLFDGSAVKDDLTLTKPGV